MCGSDSAVGDSIKVRLSCGLHLAEMKAEANEVLGSWPDPAIQTGEKERNIKYRY